MPVWSWTTNSTIFFLSKASELAQIAPCNQTIASILNPNILIWHEWKGFEEVLLINFFWRFNVLKCDWEVSSENESPSLEKSNSTLCIDSIGCRAKGRTIGTTLLNGQLHVENLNPKKKEIETTYVRQTQPLQQSVCTNDKKRYLNPIPADGFCLYSNKVKSIAPSNFFRS